MSGRISEHRVLRSFSTGYALYRLEWVDCGKSRCTKCPHGPYWYAYTVIGVVTDGVSTHRLKTHYIGKIFHLLPGDPGEKMPHDPDALDEAFSPA